MKCLTPNLYNYDFIGFRDLKLAQTTLKLWDIIITIKINRMEEDKHSVVWFLMLFGMLDRSDESHKIMKSL